MACRDQYLESVDDVPLAHRGPRIRKLAVWVDRAERAGNIPLAAELLQQIAKEAGGMYSKNGEPIQPQKSFDVRALSDEELRERIIQAAEACGLQVPNI